MEKLFALQTHGLCMLVRAGDRTICIRVTVDRLVVLPGFKAVLTMKLKTCLPGWDPVLTGK